MNLPIIDHPAVRSLRKALAGTVFEGTCYLVGGCVRDSILGAGAASDLDIVTTQDAESIAQFLWKSGVAQEAPAIFKRFGTAKVRLCGTEVEWVTARRESYSEESRKPVGVEPSSLMEDAFRRDFTINCLMAELGTGELLDLTGKGIEDLREGTIRTPLDPDTTFFDDPLRMLRAVRFRNRFGFEYADGLAESIKRNAGRLEVVSVERICTEFNGILGHPSRAQGMRDLQDLNLLCQFLPELSKMQGVTQGKWHHQDVLDHTLSVLEQIGDGDLVLCLAALFHDVGKPETRMVDEAGEIRFLGHESVGASITRESLIRLKYPGNVIEQVCILVKNHMRLGTLEKAGKTAYRRLIRDLGDNLEPLLALVEADVNSLRTSKKLDIAAIRKALEEVGTATPPHTLTSPLSGDEIMDITGFEPGPMIKELKAFLSEAVIEGQLNPSDKAAAISLLKKFEASAQGQSPEVSG